MRRAGWVRGVAVVAAIVVTQPAPAGASTAVVWENGAHNGSPDANAPRPSLSLSKLYLGYWVLRHGAPADKARVEHMIRVSDDGIATQLDARYPNAIDDVARQFGLTATARNGYWGNSVTSAYDVARFIQAVRWDPVAAPIILGMRTAAPVAADGSPQNFGTSRLPGAQGTKFGWADDPNSATGSVSFGPGWTAAALTLGGPQANTDEALRDIHVAAPGAPGSGGPGGPGEPGGPLTMQLGSSTVPALPLRDLIAQLVPGLPPQILAYIPADWLVPVGLPL
ncbi:hypothetical protein [Corynebacterium sp. CNCTC7651]|uniref:hypothetical protein n=1 Tax=Corynebacterium sp. CNCTC7651 TaxID=2815361 RepID=UPI001F489F14|nr:hypothetical protein [Corynebacterium sp. CNCTC7651]